MMKHAKKEKTKAPLDDLERYIARRKTKSSRFAERFEEGYQAFKIGAMLQAEREKAGLSQVELAQAIVTRVSRLPAPRQKKRVATSVGRKFGHLTQAIGEPLTVQELDSRLKKAISGQEKGVPASVAIKATRKRLGL